MALGAPASLPASSVAAVEEAGRDAGAPREGSGIVPPMSEPSSHHDEEVLGKAYDARLMRRLLGYIRPYRGMTATALALILASSVFQLVGPLATAVALDLFIRPQGSEG